MFLVPTFARWPWYLHLKRVIWSKKYFFRVDNPHEHHASPWTRLYIIHFFLCLVFCIFAKKIVITSHSTQSLLHLSTPNWKVGQLMSFGWLRCIYSRLTERQWGKICCRMWCDMRDRCHHAQVSRSNCTRSSRGDGCWGFFDQSAPTIPVKIWSRDYINRWTVEKTGAFVSQFGNKQWL